MLAIKCWHEHFSTCVFICFDSEELGGFCSFKNFLFLILGLNYLDGFIYSEAGLHSLVCL